MQSSLPVQQSQHIVFTIQSNPITFAATAQQQLAPAVQPATAFPLGPAAPCHGYEPHPSFPIQTDDTQRFVSVDQLANQSLSAATIHRAEQRTLIDNASQQGFSATTAAESSPVADLVALGFVVPSSSFARF